MAYCEERGIPHSRFLSWDAADRAKVIAYRLERAETCTRCGTSAWQWEADPFAFEAEVQQCQGCLHMDAKRQDIDPTDLSRIVVLVPRRIAAARRLQPVATVMNPVEARRKAREAARE